MGDEDRRAGVNRGDRTSRSKTAFIPVLFFLVIGLLILSQEVPLVSNWIDQTFRPQTWEARKACERAALATVAQPQFARVLGKGEVHSTSDGFLVEGLVLGEMSENGAEVRTVHTCYVDANGNLVNSAREPYEAPPSPAAKRSLLEADD